MNYQLIRKIGSTLFIRMDTRSKDSLHIYILYLCCIPIESQDIISRLTHPNPHRSPEGTVISIHFCILSQPESNQLVTITIKCVGGKSK